jgi:predicted transcriptional regulator
MKSYTLELDDDLVEQLSRLDNARELITNAIKTLINPQQTQYEAWFENEIRAALAEADDPNSKWVSHETVANLSKKHSESWLVQAQQPQ